MRLISIKEGSCIFILVTSNIIFSRDNLDIKFFFFISSITCSIIQVFVMDNLSLYSCFFMISGSLSSLLNLLFILALVFSFDFNLSSSFFISFSIYLRSNKTSGLLTLFSSSESLKFEFFNFFFSIWNFISSILSLTSFSGYFL